MNIFFHHVGKDGAKRDFRTTVFTRQRINLVAATLPEIFKKDGNIVRTLWKHFPDGYFNCWGIPAGGKDTISNLSAGDAVLLIKNTGTGGTVPAMGIVKAYWHIELKKLSFNLWRTEHYPYIFFFQTEELNLSYSDFKKHLGYADNFNPHGEFRIAGEKAFPNFRPHSEYIEFLRKYFLRYPKSGRLSAGDVSSLLNE